MLISCGKESHKEDFAVRVNKTYLKFSELDSLSMNSKQYGSELIRKWVDHELLYQQAVKEGIPDSKEFRYIIDNSRRELAVSMMIDKFLRDKEITADSDVLSKYFEENKDIFRFDNDSYLVNLIKFSNEDVAINFRASVLNGSWNGASALYKTNSAKSFEERNTIRKAGEVYPEGLMRIVEELNPSEVSIVFKEENNAYYVLQLINKFPKGTIPPFDYIKPDVEKRYFLKERETALREYLEELYSNNDIEIRTGKK